METSTEDALASQVLEIIGGITPEALHTLEEPDVWSTEEGDDSVFYSDEDRAHLDIKANTSWASGANDCKRLVNSLAADEDDPGEELIIGEELGADVTRQVIQTEQEEERQELQTPKTEPTDHLDPADPGARSNLTPEKSESTCEGSPTCTNMQTQTRIPAEKERKTKNVPTSGADLPVEKEEVTPNPEPFDASNTRLDGEAGASEQSSCAEVQMSGDGQLQVEPEQDFHVPVGFHQNPSPGYSTLPLPNKSVHQKSFNHLSSSKYGTVSYRKIRRGNTREKIEEFEYMVMNL